MTHLLRAFILLALFSVFPFCVQAEAALQRRIWEVEGVNREALVSLPTVSAPISDATPLIFVFHGHGGTMQHAARVFSLHRHWPEAACIYLQGLPTVGRLTDPEGKKSGWQTRRGEGNDRDLKFFDAVLASFQREHKISPDRIYATGHSNGGAFTYLLWACRSDQIAAVAPSAASAGAHLQTLKPKPVLHLAGRKDALVRYAWQESTITALRKINDCEAETALQLGINRFSSPLKCPVWCFLHPGAHGFPAQAPEWIVRFFKAHPRPDHSTVPPK